MKLNRKLHDAYLALANTTMGEVKSSLSDNKIKNKTKLRNANKYTWKNQFSDIVNDHAFSIDVESPAIYCYHLNNVYVVGDESHIFFDNKHFFGCCPRYQKMKKKKMRRPLKWLSTKINEPVFYLCGHASDNRGHFMIEHIPRLLSCLDLLRKNGIEKILISPNSLKASLPFLENLGFKERNIIQGFPGTFLFQNLYYVPLISESKKTSYFPMGPSEYYIKLRHYLLNECPKLESLGDYIFITRNNSPNRHLANEAEIIKLVRDFFPDLKVVEMGKFSFKQQVALFSKAKFIMGAHGQPFRYLLLGNKLTSIQLHPGFFGDRLRPWPYLYDFLGALTGNSCVTLRSNQSHPEYSKNYSYPLEKLGLELEKIRKTCF